MNPQEETPREQINRLVDAKLAESPKKGRAYAMLFVLRGNPELAEASKTDKEATKRPPIAQPVAIGDRLRAKMGVK